MTKNYDEVFVKRGTKTNYEIDFVGASYVHFLAAGGYDGWMLSIPFKLSGYLQRINWKFMVKIKRRVEDENGPNVESNMHSKNRWDSLAGYLVKGFWESFGSLIP